MHKCMSPHGDFDHVGEAINLVNNFKVENVIFNCGPYNDLEQDLIKVLDKKKIKYYSCIKELNIDKNKLYFLQTDIEDEKRLYRRNQARKGNYNLNKTAVNSGVKDLARFHNAGYKGLYNGETADDI